MSDNQFAKSENVGQLFDALWYNAVSTTLAEGALAVTEDRPFSESNVQRAREQAIGQAHKRYEELTNASG